MWLPSRMNCPPGVRPVTSTLSSSKLCLNLFSSMRTLLPEVPTAIASNDPIKNPKTYYLNCASVLDCVWAHRSLHRVLKLKSAKPDVACGLLCGAQVPTHISAFLVVAEYEDYTNFHADAIVICDSMKWKYRLHEACMKWKSGINGLVQLPRGYHPHGY